MHVRSETALETRLAEALMSALWPCDLGDGIEVVHDVEMIEIEMDCDLGDDAWESSPYEKIELLFESVVAVAPPGEPAAFHVDFERSGAADTLPFAPFEPDESVPFLTVIESIARETVPYPRFDRDVLASSRCAPGSRGSRSSVAPLPPKPRPTRPPSSTSRARKR